MSEATLSSKNQIVIPREAREALQLKPGDKLIVRVHGEKVHRAGETQVLSPGDPWPRRKVSQGLSQEGTRQLEIARFRALIRAHRLIAIDTCVFIYQWEANKRYWPLTDLIFPSVERSHILPVTSTITMTELLVHPYRNKNGAEASELFGLLSVYPNLAWISPDLEIAARAAQIRAQYGLQTPDALQAATALHANATAIITNDRIFKRVPNLSTLVLDDYV